jgi:hypothetical protein
VLGAPLAGCAGSADNDHASKDVVTDDSGDVIVTGPHLKRGAIVAAPENTTADIVGTRVENRAHSVWVQVKFRRLRPRQYLDLTADIRTDLTGQREWQLTALTYRGDEEPTLYGFAGDAPCAAVTAEFDYPKSVVTMTVPRRCLDNPAWIQVRVAAATMQYDAPSGTRYADAVWEDDAYQAGMAGATEQSSGPRLHHP